MAKITRNRKIKSCKYCYEHRLKCNRDKPCSNCTRLKIHECVYNFDEANSTGKNTNIFITNTSNNDKPLLLTSAFFPFLDGMSSPFLFESHSHTASQGTLHALGRYDYSRLPYKFTLTEILNALPTRDTSETYMRVYWSRIHPLIPVLNPTAVSTCVNQLWEEFASRRPITDINFLLLFIAIMFSSTTVLEVSVNQTDKLRGLSIQKNDLFEAFSKLRHCLNYPASPTEEAIQASLLVSEVSTVNGKDAAFETSTNIRAAQMLGINKKPTDLELNSPETLIKEELRKMLWHCLKVAELKSSFYLGLPSSYTVFYETDSLPSTLFFNPKTQKLDGQVDPFLTFCTTRFEVFPLFRRFLLVLTMPKGAYEDFLSLDSLHNEMLHMYEVILESNRRILQCQSHTQATLRWMTSHSSILAHRFFLLHDVAERNFKTKQEPSVVKNHDKESSILLNRSDAADSSEDYKQILFQSELYHEHIVLVALCLLYESKIRITIYPELEDFKWFTRNANPFQYLLLIMRDIFNRPELNYDFQSLPLQIVQLVPEELTTWTGPDDMRVTLCSEVIERLEHLCVYWPKSSAKMLALLKKVLAFVEKNTADPGTDLNRQLNTEEKFQYDDLFSLDLDFLANGDQIFDLLHHYD